MWLGVRRKPGQGRGMTAPKRYALVIAAAGALLAACAFIIAEARMSQFVAFYIAVTIAVVFGVLALVEYRRQRTRK